MTCRGFGGVVRVTIALMLFGISGVSVQAQVRSEYEIKAAYLYSFGRFVEWPSHLPRDEGSFAICVLGSDPFGPALDTTLTGVALRGKRVVARRIDAAKDAAECHILFISASEEQRLVAIMQALHGTDALTVSDMPQFVSRGGMIQFVTAGSKVRFEINLPPTREAGLTMSSELLRVASAVRTDRSPGE